MYITYTSNHGTVLLHTTYYIPPTENACIKRVEIPHDSSPAPRNANYLWYHTSASAGELAIAYSLTQHFSIHTTHTRVIINPVEG